MSATDHIEKADLQAGSHVTETLKDEATVDDLTYLSGWRLHCLTIALFLSIFLVNFEISIVSTSLVSITDDLLGFGRSSWVVTSYLMVYTAFMVVLAKLSDNVGRKSVLLLCLSGFIVFSGGCGAAQTMNQLIVLRAFQGLGASGVYSLVCIVLFELVPKEKYPRYSVCIAALFVVSLLLGPLLGGLISERSTWRWVFLLNVPVGLPALGLLCVCMPKGFPRHDHPGSRPPQHRRTDLIGAFLMLLALTLVITGFEEASNFSRWTSAVVLAPLIISALAWMMFLGYERYITVNDTESEPVFPWRFCTNGAIVGIMINAFLAGATFTTCVIQIPLRFQVVNNETSWQAGIRLVPFGLAVPVGVALTAAICGKRRLPPIYLLFVASALKIIGIVFLSRVTLDRVLWKGQYGLQFVTGLGCGLSIGVTQLMVPFVIEKRDLGMCKNNNVAVSFTYPCFTATSTSASVQFRILGGAIALATVTAAMNSTIKPELAALVSQEELAHLLRTTTAIHILEQPIRMYVQMIFMDGYNLQLKILVGFAAAEIPATCLIWQRDQVRIA
ncbi:putative multidrug resistance protein fnx1 [Clohesyomyces aquaticus]|uniref:Putative multidrug resistance protein fnx1 n=1 Tax=Clohesyomyces aquaticus TaxID=1231657 RepID=A0A1Y2A5T2_9PLEO|nr:putative multidrug resistance protein fnx1 [Clohesyomyces aquaticus]